MALAFPGQQGSMAEQIAIDAFMDACQDCALCKQVMIKSPATLAEALTWAIRIEAIDDSGTSDTPVSSDRDGPRKTRAFVQAASDDVMGPPASESLPQLQASLQASQASLQASQAELAQWKALATQ